MFATVMRKSAADIADFAMEEGVWMRHGVGLAAICGIGLSQPDSTLCARFGSGRLQEVERGFPREAPISSATWNEGVRTFSRARTISSFAASLRFFEEAAGLSAEHRIGWEPWVNARAHIRLERVGTSTMFAHGHAGCV